MARDRLAARAALLNRLHDRRREVVRLLSTTTLETRLADIRAWKREHAQLTERIDAMERRLS